MAGHARNMLIIIHIIPLAVFLVSLWLFITGISTASYFSIVYFLGGGLGMVISSVFLGIFAIALWRALRNGPPGSPASASDPQTAIEQMAGWLESPLELGYRPKDISVRSSHRIMFPGSDKKTEIFVVEFTQTDGEVCRGLCGPMAWSYFDKEPNRLSDFDLAVAFSGHIALMRANQQGVFQQIEPSRVSNIKEYIALIERAGLEQVEMKGVLMFGKVLVCEFSAMQQVDGGHQPVTGVTDGGRIFVEPRSTSIFQVPTIDRFMGLLANGMLAEHGKLTRG